MSEDIKKSAIYYLFKRKISIPTGSLLVLFIFIGACWLEIFHMKSHSNGTVAVVYKMRICIVVTGSLILAELPTD